MKLLNFKRKNAARGFTLIEILLAVAFIAVASLAVYGIYSKVTSGGSANTESRNLDTLRSGIKGLYGSSSTYGAVGATMNKVLNNGRVTPDSMRAIPYVKDDASINNSFGGAVDVSPVTLGGAGVGNGFRITYKNVPSSVCSKLVTGSGSSFDAVTVAGTNIKEFGSGTLQIANLAAACADTATGVIVMFDSL